MVKLLNPDEALASVIKSARAILEKNTFEESAREIFDQCRKLTGAVSGYVALLNEDGSENEVLFLEAGGMPCSVNPDLPMPIRGLRATSYETHKTVYDNDFANSQWVEYLPKGHVVLKNVMFAPLNIDKKTVGLIGLANKPSDFTDNDAYIASVFSELAAVALLNSRHIQLLNEKTIALEKALSEIKLLSRTDGLTGIANRRYFDEVLEQEFKRHCRSKKRFSLIMLDIDHFKLFNDSYGHIKGDECLQQIANVIADCVNRSNDLPSRYGGEEFACVLPETDNNGAVILAEKIREKIIACSIPHKASLSEKYVTCSIGVVTTFCNALKSATDVVLEADKMLYLAKKSGRNRVEFVDYSN